MMQSDVFSSTAKLYKDFVNEAVGLKYYLVRFRWSDGSIIKNKNKLGEFHLISVSWASLSDL